MAPTATAEPAMASSATQTTLSSETSLLATPSAVAPSSAHEDSSERDAQETGSQVEESEGQTSSEYSFPTHRLRTKGVEASKEPLVLVGCGSFSPITFLHLRMFSLAADYVRINTNYSVVGMYLSPVGDSYKKKGLAPARHRLAMTEIAAEMSETIMVDHWEATRDEYVPTHNVLHHFNREINEILGGVEDADGNRRKVKIALLAGADLIATMSSIPPVWNEEELEVVLGEYGAFVIERSGVNIPEALGAIKKWEHNVHYILQTVSNDISSTKVRLLLKRDLSIDFLIPHGVVRYIKENRLYKDDT